MASNPTLITTPFAKNGDKTTPPNTNTPSDGRFSQSLGFPPVTAIPLGSGGKAPKREDFNGAFNMLANILFYAQKGWTFLYSSSQDYYKGCMVIDPDNFKRYQCVADMTAGTVAPHSDSSGTYWKLVPLDDFLTPDKTPAYNKRDEVTTSGTYTAPVTGWYRITVKGGGGGGQGGGTTETYSRGGAGGGEGGITIGYAKMTAGSTATVVIGAGGSAGTGAWSTTLPAGSSGGNSSVTVNGTTLTANGGYGGDGVGANGGNGTIKGAGGACAGTLSTYSTYGSPGGGNGGGHGGGLNPLSAGAVGVQGGGGGGGAGDVNVAASNGGVGGNGYVWFEYFDSSLN